MLTTVTLPPCGERFAGDQGGPYGDLAAGTGPRGREPGAQARRTAARAQGRVGPAQRRHVASTSGPAPGASMASTMISGLAPLHPDIQVGLGGQAIAEDTGGDHARVEPPAGPAGGRGDGLRGRSPPHGVQARGRG